MCSICGKELFAKLHAVQEDALLTIPSCFHMAHSGCVIEQVVKGNFFCKTCNQSIVDEHTLRSVCMRAKVNMESTSDARSINSLLQKICQKAYEDVVYLRKWILAFHLITLFVAMTLLFVFSFTDKTAEDQLASYTLVFYFLSICLLMYTSFEAQALQLLINKLQS